MLLPLLLCYCIGLFAVSAETMAMPAMAVPTPAAYLLAGRGGIEEPLRALLKSMDGLLVARRLQTFFLSCLLLNLVLLHTQNSSAKKAKIR